MPTSFRSIAPPAAARPDALATAAGIGGRIVRAAVWYRARCNWVAPAVEAARGRSQARVVHRALGPDLGGGTAGVALALAQLHAAGADDALARTARGAIEQALAHVDEIPRHAARGLYAGRLGVAYAAARCGVLLADERLLARAARVARAAPPPTAAADLVQGTAGAVAGLLALAGLLGDDRLVSRAAQLGDELAGTATRGPAGGAWRSPSSPAEHPLCGFSRGAAGAAWALLELFARTGEARHRDAALRALDYERRWHDPDAGGWPDLRGIDRGERRGRFVAPREDSWAHGAPGIALARLRAWSLLGDERLRTEALAALTTTAARVERGLAAAGESFALADGLAGAADALLLGADLLDDDPAGRVALARRLAEHGISRYENGLDGWPCGLPGGFAPGLLDGHAGIALFYLRIGDRRVASPLLITAPPA